MKELLPRSSRVLAVLGALLGVFLAAPLLAILPLAFDDSSYLTFPPQRFSSRWFDSVLHDSAWSSAFWLSVRLSLIDTVIAVVIGTCSALALSRRNRGVRALRTLMLAPMVLPQLVLALGLYLAVQDLGGTAGTMTLVIGQSVLATPLVFLAVGAALAGIDPSLRRAAASLGAPWWVTVWRIELPLLRRSIAGSAVLAFGLCFDESVLGYLLSPAGQQTLPSLLWQSANTSATPAIAAVSALVMGLALVLLGVLALVARPRARRRTP